MIISDKCKMVIAGDSITDCNRSRLVNEGFYDELGTGYVNLANSMLRVRQPRGDIRIVNAGIGGNTSRDLRRRWQSDVLDLQPDWVAIMIGINDVWRHFDTPFVSEIQVGPEEYGENLAAIASSAREIGARLIWLSPFYLEANKNDAMRQKADAYIDIMRKVAAGADELFVDVQAAFDEAMRHHYTADISRDRVHPNQSGHMLIAEALLAALQIPSYMPFSD